MFFIRYITNTVIPNAEVVLRTSRDGWMVRGGRYVDGAWQFILDEEAFPDAFEFKFAISPNLWMDGQNITVPRPQGGKIFDYDDEIVHFPDFAGLVIENGVVAKTLLKRDVNNDHYDVIVVGSGMGGGILASALADRPKRVLVLEAGSLLFPIHVGNLPRRLLIGQFEKHIWSLWENFKVVNYTQGPGSDYHGAQGFNLGGRSLFWGSLIPCLSGWELDAWPPAVRDYLTSPGGNTGYDKARRVFNADLPIVSPFQQRAMGILEGIPGLQGWVPQHSPVAVEYTGATNLSIPAGIFSTADLLLEDVLAQEPPVLRPGRKPLTVNLNHAVRRVMIDKRDPTVVTGVECYDLLAQKERTYEADKVVLCAGTIESAKIALQSGLEDPNEKIGKGITDHTIMYRHFVIPPRYWTTKGVPLPRSESAKFVIKHPAAAVNQHSFDIVLELGAQFNQGRYVDPDHLKEDQDINSGGMLCEIVFQFYAPLQDSNTIETVGDDPANPVRVFMTAVQPPNNVVNEAKTIAMAVFNEFMAIPIKDEPSLELGAGLANLIAAPLGGVAHEVGTLRMATNNGGVVDERLKFPHYKNLYACDNSVFPVSPCGNPSLTLAALALRLAGDL
jgi:hypothetical protein